MIIAVYAIMRDEAPNVGRWCVSTLDADHRTVLDTGSGDGTVGLLIERGVKVHHGGYDPFRFDDARNAALALVPPDVDVCLRLDADERLAPGWRDVVTAAYHDDPSIARWSYRVVNHGTGWGEIRRNDLHTRWGQRWVYPTHEVLIGRGLQRPLDALVVHHHPPSQRRPHHDTNLEVLSTAVYEYRGDHRMAFYFARELYNVGNWADARTAMTRFLDMPGGWAPERCEAWRILAFIDDLPERWMWRAVGECPERREPWVDLARFFATKGQWDRATTMIREASLRTDESIYTTDQACWGEAFEHLRVSIEHEALAV